jgi:hypothetical protein
MKAMTDGWWLWIAANVVGMALFLYLAVQTWIEPELANEPGANGGEFIVWGITALPVLLLFLLAHFGFGLLAFRQAQRSGSWRGEIFVGATLICWIAVFLYDNAHHGVA